MGSRATACPLLTGTAELDLAGGHDDNLMLSVSPDAPETLLRRGGAYGSLGPVLSGTCNGRGMAVRLAFFGDYRGATDVGRLDTHTLELRGWLPRWGPLRLQLAGTAGAFLATGFPEDEYWYTGGELGAVTKLGDDISLGLAMRADMRTMRASVIEGGQRDWLLAPSVRLAAQPASHLEVAPFFSALVVRPTSAVTDSFGRWRSGVELTATWRGYTFNGDGWGGRIRYGEVTETHVGGRLQVRYELAGFMDVYVAAELSEPVSPGSTADYARRLVTAGTTVRAAYQRRRTAAAPPDLRPRVEGGGVRFRFRSERALEVALVGSWNDWATPGVALSPTRENGLWELSTTLPPGTHRYHFLVDGEAHRPPDAVRYVADDFGSEDGVVEVGPGNAAGALPAQAAQGGGR